MNLIFADHAWDGYLYWQKTDNKMVKRINSDSLSEDSTGFSWWSLHLMRDCACQVLCQ
ncbi:MAG: type II toxin-antitoxin system YoeB family toxin [Gammaproteobacteria bacterium]|nr:type II toxin-antitoxin system YoeB family toxin [Gammaproteobacteria bacterium]